MHNNTSISPLMCYFTSKTWIDLSEMSLETFSKFMEFVILMDFSKFLEKARPNIALMVNFVEF